MFGAFKKFGRMGSGGGAWSERALWPLGAASPGLWIDGPSYPAACWQDSAGTTALSTVGAVLDSSNPIGLMLDRKAGATSKTDPGLHLSQATSSARPVASARVNLLTKTEDFSNAVWELVGGTTATATTITIPAGGRISQYFTLASGNYALGASLSGSGTVTIGIMTSGYSQIADQVVVLSGTPAAIALNGVLAGTLVGFFISSVAGATVTPTSPRLNLGSTALPYQRVNTASDYDASAGPAYLKFDGTDDSLATATFAAGTLTSSMDCLIAVRRDSAAEVIVGPYKTTGGLAWIGRANLGDNTDCVSNVGNPTVLVDGTALAARTVNNLALALTVGSWHIFELLGLDLSAWTTLSIDDFAAGYRLNGGIGEIQLFASGQDANRDKARARMAAYFGVTLV